MISLFAAPAAFSAPYFLSIFYTKPGKPYYNTKAYIELPLKKSTKSIVCVNRNFNDTQKFGNALCEALEQYSFDCVVKLAEFVKKEEVVGYDYVWSFQVNKWKDKNRDGAPDKVNASILVYDRDFNKLLKSSVKIRKSKDLQAPSCLETLVKEYVNSIYNEVVEDKKADKPKAEKEAKAADKNAENKADKKAKKEKAPKEKKAKKAKNEKQAE